MPPRINEFIETMLPYGYRLPKQEKPIRTMSPLKSGS